MTWDRATWAGLYSLGNPRRPGIPDPPASVSQVAEKTDKHHQAQIDSYIFQRFRKNPKNNILWYLAGKNKNLMIMVIANITVELVDCEGVYVALTLKYLLVGPFQKFVSF